MVEGQSQRGTDAERGGGGSCMRSRMYLQVKYALNVSFCEATCTAKRSGKRVKLRLLSTSLPPSLTLADCDLALSDRLADWAEVIVYADIAS